MRKSEILFVFLQGFNQGDKSMIITYLICEYTKKKNLPASVFQPIIFYRKMRTFRKL